MTTTAHAIIGANYGDEGKGLMTDYICAHEGAGVVVRFNGGAQAGHTVVTPEGYRHVFHHFGSGSLAGVPTFLSKFFLVNPILFFEEKWESSAQVVVDPRALVTLPCDMLINQARHHDESLSNRTCGVGIHETMVRSAHPDFTMTVENMMDKPRYDRIMSRYVPQRLETFGLDKVHIESFWWEVYSDRARRFLNGVTKHRNPFYLTRSNRLVFEGAQGLMLSMQEGKDCDPYITHSYTGLRNVRELCKEWEIDNLHATYVTRSYLTRHGDGPLPNLSPLPNSVVDLTNIDNQYQGPLRYAPLDVAALKSRITADAADTPFDLAVTCLDHESDALAGMYQAQLPVRYLSSGPTRKDVFSL